MVEVEIQIVEVVLYTLHMYIGMSMYVPPKYTEKNLLALCLLHSQIHLLFFVEMHWNSSIISTSSS